MLCFVRRHLFILLPRSLSLRQHSTHILLVSLILEPILRCLPLLPVQLLLVLLGVATLSSFLLLLLFSYLFSVKLEISLGIKDIWNVLVISLRLSLASSYVVRLHLCLLPIDRQEFVIGCSRFRSERRCNTYCWCRFQGWSLHLYHACSQTLISVIYIEDICSMLSSIYCATAIVVSH